MMKVKKKGGEEEKKAASEYIERERQKKAHTVGIYKMMAHRINQQREGTAYMYIHIAE